MEFIQIIKKTISKKSIRGLQNHKKNYLQVQNLLISNFLIKKGLKSIFIQ